MADTGNQDDPLIQAVENHYKDAPDRPLYASELGKTVREKGIHMPPGVTVLNYIRSMYEGRLCVVQDPDVPARIAIAQPNNQTKIAQLISGRGLVESAPETEFRRLPFALTAAFCRAPTKGKKLFFATRRPFRYVSEAAPPNSDYVEIEEDYQPPDLRGLDAHQLSEDQRLIVYSSIARWALAKNIRLSDFYVITPASTARNTPIHSSSRNALERFIGAQDDDIKSRIKIPMDIAQLLMNNS